MPDEPQEFHQVSDQEADQIIEACNRAIPHNEWLGRLIRNMYGRLQAVEKELAELKAALAERRGPT